MDIATDKDTMLERVRGEWWRLQRALAEMEQNEMIEIHVEENWTAKDIVAHVAYWEGLLLDWLQEANEGRTPEIPGHGYSSWDDIDRMNEANYLARKDEGLHAVLQEAAEVHERLVDVLNHLPEDAEDERWSVWRDGKPPWSLIAGNTYRHYAEHRESIEAYLNETGKPGSPHP